MPVPVQARVVAVAPTEVTVEVGGTLGRVPLAEIPAPLQPLTPQLVGQKITVTQINKKNRLYSYNSWLTTQPTLPAGQIGVGTIRAITRQNLYIEARGAIYVVPRAQATLSRIATLADLFRLGQVVSVIDGSVVAAQANSWHGLDLPRGTTVCGVVVDIISKGDRPAILIEIVPGILGIADIPPLMQIRRGDKATGKVVRFDEVRRRIRIDLTHVGDRAIPSPATTPIIVLLETYGPLPIAAADLICPGASALARRARGTICIRDLGGEPGFWLTGQAVELPSHRQHAFGWFVARAFEAGCNLTRSSKESWLFTTPRGRQTAVVVFPDRSPPAGGIVILPYGAEAPLDTLSIPVSDLQSYQLTSILQKQK